MLDYLFSSPDYGRRYVVSGVVVSSRDRYRPAIANRVEGKGITVFLDDERVHGEYDLGCCIGFPRKISGETLSRCHEGAFNLHFAPLPAYRGSGTLPHAIINQEPEYGVTLHRMDEHIDTGPIVATKTYPLPRDKTAMAITEEVEDLAYDLLVENIDALVDGSYELVEQEQVMRRTGVVPRFYTRRSVEELYRVERSWEFEKLHRYLRALTGGRPKAPFFEDAGRRIYLSLTAPDADRTPTAPATGLTVAVAFTPRPDGSVLLVRRLGIWELPRDTPRDGETLQEAARRAVLDSCGLAVTVHGPLAVTDERAGGERPVVIAFLCTAATASIRGRRGDGYEELAWMSKDQLPPHDIDDVTADLLTACGGERDRIGNHLPAGAAQLLAAVRERWRDRPHTTRSGGRTNRAT